MKYKAICMVTLFLLAIYQFSAISAAASSDLESGGLIFNPNVITDTEKEGVITESVTDQIGIPLFTNNMMVFVEQYEEDSVEYTEIVNHLFQQAGNQDDTEDVFANISYLFTKEYEAPVISSEKGRQTQESLYIIQFVVLFLVLLLLYFIVYTIYTRRQKIKTTDNHIMDDET